MHRHYNPGVLVRFEERLLVLGGGLGLLLGAYLAPIPPRVEERLDRECGRE